MTDYNSPVLSPDDHNYHQYVARLLVEARAIESAWLNYLASKYNLDFSQVNINQQGLIVPIHPPS